MLDFSFTSWVIIVLCAISIGFSKTSGIGLAIAFVPLLAMIMDSKESVGFMLPMLCMADLPAVIYWRKHVQWKSLTKLAPWTLAGIATGYVAMSYFTSRIHMPVIGVIILVMMAVTFWRESRLGNDYSIPNYWWFAAIMGVMAGFTTMMANAAGPAMVIYLLAMKMKKNDFVGTSAWFFWFVNLIKVPLNSQLDLITMPSFMTNLVLLPAIIAGGWLGVVLVHKLPQKVFNRVVSVLAVLAAVYLCVKALLI